MPPSYSKHAHAHRTRFVTDGENKNTAGVAPAAPSEGVLPSTLERVGKTEAFPNQYPGQNYAFNWCLNGDGVTPVNKSAFRIVKPLDLRVAGLSVPKKNPLSVRLLLCSLFCFFVKLILYWLLRWKIQILTVQSLFLASCLVFLV